MLYGMLFNVKFYIRLSSFRVVIGPNKIVNMKNFFFFIFAYYMLSHTDHLYVFDFSFLNIILEVLFMGLYRAKYTCYFL